MNWIVFSYSLPSKGQSSPRVLLWRRLRRLGAVSPKNGLHVLPAREECREALQWLTQEVLQAKGEALVMHVDRFEGLEDGQLKALFNQARAEEYTEIMTQAEQLRQAIGLSPELQNQHREALAKLQKAYSEIAQIDFFDSPEGPDLASNLARIRQSLSTSELTAAQTTLTLDAYQDKIWVTRPRPHVDRLACIWLIRRYINATARIRYTHQAQADEISFDMKEGTFTHQGNLCTFEVMVATFGLTEPALEAIAQIVHELDLRDGLYTRPETVGVETILRGWLRAGLQDDQLETHGIMLFEGLFATFSQM